jgi:hypothetical protein
MAEIKISRSSGKFNYRDLKAVDHWRNCDVCDIDDSKFNGVSDGIKFRKVLSEVNVDGYDCFGLQFLNDDEKQVHRNGSRSSDLRGVVLHHTAGLMAGLENTILTRYVGVKHNERGWAHFYITPDGAIIQASSLKKGTLHSGCSDKWGKDVNDDFVSIELVGCGHLKWDAVKKEFVSPLGITFKAKLTGHEVFEDGSPMVLARKGGFEFGGSQFYFYMNFTPEQYGALKALIESIKKKYSSCLISSTRNISPIQNQRKIHDQRASRMLVFW